jgi:hypothetical protein
MYAEAIEALLAMDEFTGTLEDFMSASATSIQDALECSAEEADRVLQELRRQNQVILDFTPDADLPPTVTGVPMSCWYWLLPDAA